MKKHFVKAQNQKFNYVGRTEIKNLIFQKVSLFAVAISKMTETTPNLACSLMDLTAVCLKQKEEIRKARIPHSTEKLKFKMVDSEWKKRRREQKLYLFWIAFLYQEVVWHGIFTKVIPIYHRIHISKNIIVYLHSNMKNIHISKGHFLKDFQTFRYHARG